MLFFHGTKTIKLDALAEAFPSEPETLRLPIYPAFPKRRGKAPKNRRLRTREAPNQSEDFLCTWSLQHLEPGPPESEADNEPTGGCLTTPKVKDSFQNGIPPVNQGVLDPPVYEGMNTAESDKVLAGHEGDLLWIKGVRNAAGSWSQVTLSSYNPLNHRSSTI